VENAGTAEGASKAAADAVARASREDGRVAVGVDVQEVEAFAEGAEQLMAGVSLDTLVPLLRRNFTGAELEYCRAAPDCASSLAARWAAKEAVFKALSSASGGRLASAGGGAPMAGAEVVVPKGGGAPELRLTADFMATVRAAGVQVAGNGAGLSLSLSHSGNQAVAVVAVNQASS